MLLRYEILEACLQHTDSLFGVARFPCWKPDPLFVAMYHIRIDRSVYGGVCTQHSAELTKAAMRMATLPRMPASVTASESASALSFPSCNLSASRPPGQEIASSVPIDISFRDPPPIQWDNGNEEGRVDEVDERYEDANGAGGEASRGCFDLLHVTGLDRTGPDATAFLSMEQSPS